MSAPVAKRYGKALFELSVERDQFVHVHLAFHDFNSLMRRHDDFRTLFFSHQVEAKVKMDFLQQLLGEDTNQLFLNFLKVLAVKKRLDLVFDIMKEFEAQYAKKQNRLVVNVQSAVDLDEATRTELETFFADSLKANVHVNFIKNPDILAGLIVDMEGTIIDASLRRKFKELKKSLDAASVL